MKRIEATIQTDKTSAVSDAIKELVGGYTILEGNGRGSGKRQEIRSGRGTGSFTAEYNKVASITTIVDDSEVRKSIFSNCKCSLYRKRWRWNHNSHKC